LRDSENDKSSPAVRRLAFDMALGITVLVRHEKSPISRYLTEMNRSRIHLE
jgi:hypothetical protein